MSIVSNLHIKRLWFTLSNAFLYFLSVNITYYVWDLEIKDSMKNCLKIAMLVIVDRLLQNPCSCTKIFMSVDVIFRDMILENIYD